MVGEHRLLMPYAWNQVSIWKIFHFHKTFKHMKQRGRTVSDKSTERLREEAIHCLEMSSEADKKAMGASQVF